MEELNNKLIYKSDLSSLFNGDCIEVMDMLIDSKVKVDKVITSPPYNTMRKNSFDTGYSEYRDDKDNDEYAQWICNIFDRYDKLLNKDGCILFNMSYGQQNNNCMLLTLASVIKHTNFSLADILVWKKKTATPNNVSKSSTTRICEFVFVFARDDELRTFNSNKKQLSIGAQGQAIYENVFNFFVAENNDEVCDLNKATFSIEFVNELIDRYVTKDDIVLDNFSGTGTTMVACERRNRKGYYIELSKAQCEWSINRIRDNVQLNLFDLLESE